MLLLDQLNLLLGLKKLQVLVSQLEIFLSNLKEKKLEKYLNLIHLINTGPQLELLKNLSHKQKW